MDEREFLSCADKELARIESALDRCDLDFDFEVKPGGVLELEFSDGSKIIVNRHAAAGEIWLAAKSGGFHFRWDGERWLGTRDGNELVETLSRCMSEQSGVKISLSGAS
jgi:CyaY protein